MVTNPIDKSYKELRAFFDDIDLPLALVNKDFEILKTNTMYQHEAGLPFKSILGKKLFSIFPKAMGYTEKFEQAFNAKSNRLIKISVLNDDGVPFKLFFKTFNTYGPDEESQLGLIAVSKDESETDFIKQAFGYESSSNLLIDSIEAILDAKPDDFFKVVINKAVEITKSKIGFFHTYDEAEKNIVLTVWSGEVYTGCQIPEVTHYPLDSAGIWADSIRRRKCIIINDYESAIGKKGLPEGHFPVTNCVSLPIIVKNKIVAIIGVGNRSKPYSEEDTRLLEVFSRIVWHAMELPRMSSTIVHQSEMLQQKNDDLEEKIKLRTQDLEQAKVVAEQANAAKSEFLAMMSHELRTPMNAVIGSLDLLALSDQDEDSKDLIETAKTSANNLVDILNDILDLSKIEANKLKLEYSTFDISDVIDNVIKVFLPVANEKDIVLDVDEDPSIPNLLSGDPVRVKQILFNLLGNAVKFTSTSADRLGSVKLKVVVESSLDNYVTLCFSIEDNGLGIDQDKQARLFKPFHQAELSTTRKFGGTGLGLAICKKLTTMMNGEIWLKSEKYKGTTFFVRLGFNLADDLDFDVGKLFGRSFILCSPENANPTIIQNYRQYLENEGAFVSDAGLDQLSTRNLAGQELIIFVDKTSGFRKKIKQLDALSVPSKQTYYAVERSQLNKFRNKFKKRRSFATQPLTRSQLIKMLCTSDSASMQMEKENNDLVDHKFADGYQVLVVEDNPFNQKLLAKQLNKMGIQCNIAEDGIEGLDKFAEDNFDLILTDCHMPEMDGYEMTRRIRQQEENKSLPVTPIIAVTGAAMSGDDQLCFEAGMNDFLSKPVQFNDLKNKLEKWLPS